MTEESALDKIGGWFSNESSQVHWKNFLLVCAIVGLIILIKWTVALLKFINVHCFRKCCQSKDRLYKMYGVQTEITQERSWAVVTGGSDGIGLEMCKHLARDHGFNICIVARNEEKMQQKLIEIQKERPTI